ncbi:MAG: ATP-binding protein [Deltaproteobacteria bacterium]|nr:ATP-binding protein [Deltaproteobacteria bacterium]
MKSDFLIHNLFWEGFESFETNDPHLKKLKGLKYIHKSSLETDIPVLFPGIYMLTGGRQVGKSTLLKLIIKKLLERKQIVAKQIYYLPCDTITDFKQLIFEINNFYESTNKSDYFLLLLDEVTYVREWERAIKSFADAGLFNNAAVIITGSDSLLLKEATMMFPGRRGKSSKVDFHLYPLSFREFVSLKNSTLGATLDNIGANFDQFFGIKNIRLDSDQILSLFPLFEEYMQSGGYMPAINDYAAQTKILPATYNTYIQWIVGDILKRGKQESYLKEIISVLLSRIGKQITWTNLVNDVAIEHHKTIADYIELLSRMDVVKIFQALREDKMLPAPKKAKKVCFSDPFIFHALHGYIKNENDFFALAKTTLEPSSDLKNSLIEGIIASLFNRTWESYYIKAEGEVDIAIVKNKKFLPIEIKNSVVLQKKDLKQILKYKNGIIGYAGYEVGKFDHLDVVPIPLLAALTT